MVRVLTYPSNVREVCKDKITSPSLNQNQADENFDEFATQRIILGY